MKLARPLSWALGPIVLGLASKTLIDGCNGLPIHPRRQVLAHVGSFMTILPNVASSVATSTQSLADSLISVIPSMPYEAPATNATIPQEVSKEIESMAKMLEDDVSFRQYTRNNANSPLLSGSWRLIYSNAPEITNLATNLPLGFQLSKTMQPVDTALGFFENQSELENPQRIAHLRVSVIGDVRIAPANTRNAIGVINDYGNRVDVEFRKLVFSLDELLTFPVALQKTLTPKPVDLQKQAQPANDITYLDTRMRFVRGGDGSLFIFVREQEPVPILSKSQRELLYQKTSTVSRNEVEVGVKQRKLSSPELRLLFQSQE